MAMRRNSTTRVGESVTAYCLNRLNGLRFEGAPRMGYFPRSTDP
jgi:hypothetical protein